MSADLQGGQPNKRCITGLSELVIGIDGCKPGFLCGNYNPNLNETTPVICAPSNDCILRRNAGKYNETYVGFVTNRDMMNRFCAEQERIAPTIKPNSIALKTIIAR